MDFMEMREALNIAGCVAANGNEEGFYGARPGAAYRASARTVPAKTLSMDAEPSSSSGDDPRARANIRQSV